MPTVIQPSFARGEISSTLFGRVDTAAYAVALRTAWNLVIHAFGGASNRAGLFFIGPCKQHNNPPRLIRFKFKTTDTYMLEFGNLYMRVIRNDSHVVESETTITGMTQANPIAVTSVGHGYSDGDEVALSGVVGMTEVNSRRFTVANKTADTYKLTDQVTSEFVDGTGFTAYTSGGAAQRIYEITTPYVQADLETLKFAQSADVMTLTHPSYQPRELSRTDHDAWTLAELSYLPGQVNPTALSATQNGTTGSTTYKYRVTAIAETFEESLPAVNTSTSTITGVTAANPVVVTSASHPFIDGDWVYLTGIVGEDNLNGRRFKVANKATNTFELEGEDGTLHAAYVSGGTAALTHAQVTNGNATLSVTNNVSLSWTAAADAQRYAIYKEENGLYGLLGETESLTYTDDGSNTPDLDNSPPRFREPFHGADNAPAATGYFEQRRVFGGANNRPDTSDYSRVGDHSNFTTATPAKADDAIRATLTSQEVNDIRHYVPLTDLLIFTGGEEWKIDSGDSNRFSLDTIRQKPQSRWGASHRRPVTIGNVVLYVQENDAIVRSIGFELTVDGYTGTDISLLANHIFRDHCMCDWDYSRAPDPVIHMVRADGKAATVTFNQEQQVIAWTRWGTRTPDKFEQVATIRPRSTDVDDSPFFVVKRTINGNTVRYIERVHSRRFTDVRDAFFVDCGLTFDSPVAISAVSLTDPVVVTVPVGHGFAVDDEVDISDIEWVPDVDDVSTETQPDQLNDGRFLVSATTQTTITLTDLEGTEVDATAWNAYVTGGNVRKAASTLSGFHHLAGEAVIALCDGSVVRDLTVSAAGQVTLPRKFSRVHLGFGYFADWETLDIEARGSGTIQGRQLNVHKVTARLDRSAGFWVGPDASSLVEMKQRKDEKYGEPTALITGDHEIDILPTWESDGRIYCRQRDPLPTTLLGLTPQFELEERDGG